MREQVIAAREIQRKRFAGTATRYNADMTPPPDPQVLPARRRGPRPAQVVRDGTGPFGPGPRQGPARRPDHRRPGREPADRTDAPERSDQLPHARPQDLELSSGSLPVGVVDQRPGDHQARQHEERLRLAGNGGQQAGWREGIDEQPASQKDRI